MSRSETKARILNYSFQLVNQHHGLDKFYVTKLWVPMDVCGCDKQRLMNLNKEFCINTFDFAIVKSNYKFTKDTFSI